MKFIIFFIRSTHISKPRSDKAAADKKNDTSHDITFCCLESKWNHWGRYILN